MKKKVAIVSLLAGLSLFAIPASANAFCITCVTKYFRPPPPPPPIPAPFITGVCDGHGGVASWVHVRDFVRLGPNNTLILIKVYRVTCWDGHSEEIEEESDGGICWGCNSPPPEESPPPPEEPAPPPPPDGCGWDYWSNYEGQCIDNQWYPW